MKIIIENMQELIDIDENLSELIRKAAVCCLENENFEVESEISFFLADDGKIREMNRDYRQMDKATDVLSFPMVDIDEGKILSSTGDYDMDEGLLLLGDIVISLETAKRQAIEYGHSFERELAFLSVHGVYHLLGYDHQDILQERKMLDKQEQVLAKIGMRR